MQPFSTNIEKQTLNNNYYRKVIFTGTKIQLVLMSLKPLEEIPVEIHHNIDQFLRLEFGQANAYVGNKIFHLKADDVIIIPAGTKHRILNTSKTKKLKLYSIYATPEHPDKTIHKTKADADKAEYYH